MCPRTYFSCCSNTEMTAVTYIIILVYTWTNSTNSPSVQPQRQEFRSIGGRLKNAKTVRQYSRGSSTAKEKQKANGTFLAFFVLSRLRETREDANVILSGWNRGFYRAHRYCIIVSNAFAIFAGVTSWRVVYTRAFVAMAHLSKLPP